MKNKNSLEPDYSDDLMGTTPKKSDELTDRHRKILEIFSKYVFERILDVGCGDGNFSMLLKAICNSKEIYGVEKSKKGTEFAKANGVNAFQLDIDTTDFPFKDKYFDAVFAGEIIEHLFDPDHFLDEVYRVLKPRGIFVLSTPNLAAIHNRIALLLGYEPFPLSVSRKHNIGRMYEPSSGLQSLDHVRAFTLHSLTYLLRIHKFDILCIKGSRALLPKDMKLLIFFEAMDRLSTLAPSLSYRIVLECKTRSQ